LTRWTLGNQNINKGGSPSTVDRISHSTYIFHISCIFKFYTLHSARLIFRNQHSSQPANMLSILVLSLLALNGVSAFKTDVDHNSQMTETVRAKSGYSLEEFNGLVDSVLDACDSNGCDAGTKKCNIAHCISIDGDNLDDNHDNILEIVGKFIKGSMHTEDTTIDDCTSSGCGFLPAVNYTIPGYVSLRRSNDNGDPNVLYKISISTTDAKDACGAVFDALSAAGGPLGAADLFGAIKVAVCTA
jgi:hypothetical protein